MNPRPTSCSCLTRFARRLKRFKGWACVSAEKQQIYRVMVDCQISISSNRQRLLLQAFIRRIINASWLTPNLSIHCIQSVHLWNYIRPGNIGRTDEFTVTATVTEPFAFTAAAITPLNTYPIPHFWNMRANTSYALDYVVVMTWREKYPFKWDSYHLCLLICAISYSFHLTSLGWRISCNIPEREQPMPWARRSISEKVRKKGKKQRSWGY